LLLSVRPSVCPFVAYISSNSRTQRPSVPKFGTNVSHIRCDSHTSFKVKQSKVKVRGGRGHTVSVEPGSHTACIVCVTVYVPYKRPNGWANRDQTGHGIHVDPESASGNYMLRSDRRKRQRRSEYRGHKNRGAVCAERERQRRAERSKGTHENGDAVGADSLRQKRILQLAINNTTYKHHGMARVQKRRCTVENFANPVSGKMHPNYT